MKNVYAIYDSKADAYMQPFFQDTHGLALRTFEEATKQKDHIIAKYPADFTLFHLATWDDQTGNIAPMDTPISLGVAIEYANTDLQAVN